MARGQLWLMVIFACSAVLSASAYDVVKIQTVLRALPAEERGHFLRYALHRGYELAEGAKNEIYDAVPQDILVGMYQYYTDNFLKTDVNEITNLRDIICFPTGCIEIDDPGIHP